MRGASQRFVRFAAEPAGHVPFGMSQSNKICDIAILFRPKKPPESILNGGTKAEKAKKEGTIHEPEWRRSVDVKSGIGDRTGGRVKRLTDGVAPAMKV